MKGVNLFLFSIMSSCRHSQRVWLHATFHKPLVLWQETWMLLWRSIPTWCISSSCIAEEYLLVAVWQLLTDGLPTANRGEPQYLSVKCTQGWYFCCEFGSQLWGFIRVHGSFSYWIITNLYAMKQEKLGLRKPRPGLDWGAWNSLPRREINNLPKSLKNIIHTGSRWRFRN